MYQVWGVIQPKLIVEDPQNVENYVTEIVINSGSGITMISLDLFNFKK